MRPSPLRIVPLPRGTGLDGQQPAPEPRSQIVSADHSARGHAAEAAGHHQARRDRTPADARSKAVPYPSRAIAGPHATTLVDLRGSDFGRVSSHRRRPSGMSAKPRSPSPPASECVALATSRRYPGKRHDEIVTPRPGFARSQAHGACRGSIPDGRKASCRQKSARADVGALPSGQRQKAAPKDLQVGRRGFGHVLRSRPGGPRRRPPHVAFQQQYKPPAA